MSPLKCLCSWMQPQRHNKSQWHWNVRTVSCSVLGRSLNRCWGSLPLECAAELMFLLTLKEAERFTAAWSPVLYWTENTDTYRHTGVFPLCVIYSAALSFSSERLKHSSTCFLYHGPKHEVSFAEQFITSNLSRGYLDIEVRSDKMLTHKHCVCLCVSILSL